MEAALLTYLLNNKVSEKRKALQDLQELKMIRADVQSYKYRGVPYTRTVVSCPWCDSTH